MVRTVGIRGLRAASLALVAGLLAGCGGGRPSPSTAVTPARQQKELVVGGQKRAYRVFAPPSLDRSRPPPLVLVLGGYGNTAESMVETTQFDRQAIEGGFVVVYPEGLGLTWNAGYCCGSAARDGVDDVAFLTAVMDQVQADHGTDRARVFVAGVSNGGMMAYRLACRAADRVAGIGSMAGAMILDDCEPGRPVAVIEIHGTADPLVPYEGGPTVGGATRPSPSSRAVAQRWAELDRCPEAPATTAKPPVTTSTWSGCAPGSAVRLVTVDGGGHTWFAPNFGPANGAVDATAEMWAFFSGLPARS
jgi:polyhydroxybutyrate depolymerase